jgi:hypothetical protein
MVRLSKQKRAPKPKKGPARPPSVERRHQADAAGRGRPVAGGTSWVFEESGPMGGASGEAFTNTLASTGMSAGDLLAREAIQNSVDAHSDEADKVKVRFRAVSASKAQKATFVAAACLSEIAARSTQLNLAEPNCLKGIGNPNEPLNLLFVDDFHTTGLVGEPHDPTFEIL